MAAVRSPARLVHDTPELLHVILGGFTPELDGDLISHTSLACLEYLAQTYHHSVTWKDYATICNWKNSKVKIAYLSASRAIKVTDLDRSARNGDTGKLSYLIFNPKSLLDAKAACPRLTTIATDVKPWPRINEYVATFPPHSAAPDSPLPQLCVTHAMDIVSITRVEGCEDEWAPQQWKGWDVKGQLCLTIRPSATAQTQQVVKQKIITRFNSPKYRRDVISKLRLQGLPWSMQELRHLLEFPSQGTMPIIRKIWHLEVQSLLPFLPKDLGDLGQHAGTNLTFLKLGSREERSGAQLLAEQLPDVMDILPNFPALRQLIISIDWAPTKGETDLGWRSKDRVTSSLARSTSLRLEIEAGALEEIDRGRTLQLVQALLKRCGPQVGLVWKSYRANLTLPAPGEWSQIGKVIDHFSRPVNQSRKEIFLKTDNTQLGLSSISEIIHIALLPSGRFPTADERRKQAMVTTARMRISKYRRNVIGVDADVQRRQRSAQTDWLNVDVLRHSTERAITDLGQLGVPVEPLDWPSEDDIPTYHRIGSCQNKLQRLEKSLAEKDEEMANKDAELAKTNMELAKKDMELAEHYEAIRALRAELEKVQETLSISEAGTGGPVGSPAGAFSGI